MFFPRLRRQAKWMFVFLALVFAGGFVVFGVGSNLPSGLGDILQDVQRSSTPSVGDARDRVREHPKDPAAQLALSDALQQNQRPEEAIAPLERFVKLRPRNEDALRELAGLYASKTNRLYNEANLAALEYQKAASGQLLQPKLSGAAGQGFFQSGALEQAMVQQQTDRYNKLAGELQTTSSKGQRTYERIARLDPRDPQLQLLLATAAERAGDLQTTVGAYERFLELAPEDSSAPIVRKALREVRQQIRSSANSPTASPLAGGG